MCVLHTKLVKKARQTVWPIKKFLEKNPAHKRNKTIVILSLGVFHKFVGRKDPNGSSKIRAKTGFSVWNLKE